MTSQLVEKDQRPWDARLLERMSRGASKTNGDESTRVYLAIWNAVISMIPAAATGHLYLLALTLLFPAIGVGRRRWARSKRTRAKEQSAGATPNPFGQ